MEPLTLIALFFAGLLPGLFIGLYVIKLRPFNERDREVRAAAGLEEANAQAQALKQAARAKVAEQKVSFEFEQKELVAQLDRMEKNLEHKIEMLQKRESKVKDMQTAIETEERGVRLMRSDIDKSEDAIIAALSKSTGIARQDARNQLVAEYEQEFVRDTQLRLARSAEHAQESALRESRDALWEAVHRYSASAARSGSGSAIMVQRDEVKGRIVGRGGRLIAFFEELFQVDVIFNDEPNTIIVSCFNLVQQETARLAMERLMREKNITEEVIARVKQQVDADMQKALRLEGEKALKIIGAPPMPPDFAQLVGRLKYRTSYGQNVLRHSFEVGFLARLLAARIGGDERTALMGGFFHDIGKSIDQEVGGAHDVLSKEILEKYNFPWEVVHAAWTHHNSAPQETAEARLVQAADALSAGRPGARAESVERYVARIKELESTALEFEGVRKVFAINAGRELRVVVDNEKIDDARTAAMANEIAANVQEKGGYPGKIKIVTIRTTKTTDYAR